MNKKICLITGANSGIGKAAAIQMVGQGFHVLLACRNQERGNHAVEEIKQTSKSDAVELMLVDMSLKSSIREMVKTFLSKYDKLDVLINNAALFDISQKEIAFTKEGIESIWATNHLGSVLLTERLRDPLKQSPQGRILNIASKGLIVFPFLKVDLNDPEYSNRKFKVANAYYQSKLAQIMYTYWLAEKLKDTNITVNCIRVPSVKIDIHRYPNISKLARFAYTLKSKKALAPEEMAKTYVYLSTSEKVQDMTGRYFDEKNQCVTSSNYSSDWNNINAVMALTMKYLKG